MPTNNVLFDMAGATPADGTGTGNNPPAASVRVSTGTQAANTPKATFVEWLFDDATDEHLLWSFVMPSDYSSGGTLTIQFKPASNQTGVKNVVWKAALAAVTAGDATVNAKVFPAADTATVAMTSGIAAGVEVQGSLALTATALNSLAAGDHVTLFLGRDADHASDDCSGDAQLVGLGMSYTATGA